MKLSFQALLSYDRNHLSLPAFDYDHPVNDEETSTSFLSGYLWDRQNPASLQTISFTRPPVSIHNPEDKGVYPQHHHRILFPRRMSDTSDGSRSAVLDRLNKEASIPLHTADGYSIRAWLTSAKKCLDQVRASESLSTLALFGALFISSWLNG